MIVDVSEELAAIDRIVFDDWPDQRREHLLERAVSLAVSAVQEIAAALVDSSQEEDLVEFRTAQLLLGRFESRFASDVLRLRLEERSKE